VCGTQTTTRIAVEELVEPHVILPELIEIKAIVAVVDAPSSVVRSRKQVLQTMLDLLSNLAQMHIVAATGRAFDLELRAVEQIEALKGFNEKEVDTEPDWSSPVAVATEEAAIRISRNIPDSEPLAIYIH
jgi:hypothetical protein